ncbi:type II toxin-antitoxin system RelE/ParE family toxin [sulfur-oxidizing endosymbiont of Gigantopelta aegis]|uniref:type II toxin-antitoxin system RelE/ParE family toxin n=1 Tax=sulfur-oxidizing endosymbiont of Gigantopelta aegis TaxID=2794934 RepID=UPI0018DB897F|nr:type II toxin-antitoxin system RelE/ParE family toxin [sulfur-oxidizing endosymbiont of Gigantopelta aegis]
MVKWTDHAKAQLHSIYEYISQDSPFYAKRVTEALVKKTIGLDALPHKGYKVSELNEDVVRELSLYSYRIIYEIKTSYIEVLAVIHKRQDLQADEILRD